MDELVMDGYMADVGTRGWLRGEMSGQVNTQVGR